MRRGGDRWPRVVRRSSYRGPHRRRRRRKYRFHGRWRLSRHYRPRCHWPRSFRIAIPSLRHRPSQPPIRCRYRPRSRAWSRSPNRPRIGRTGCRTREAMGTRLLPAKAFPPLRRPSTASLRHPSRALPRRRSKARANRSPRQCSAFPPRRRRSCRRAFRRCYRRSNRWACLRCHYRPNRSASRPIHRSSHSSRLPIRRRSCRHRTSWGNPKTSSLRIVHPCSHRQSAAHSRATPIPQDGSRAHCRALLKKSVTRCSLRSAF